MELYRSNVNNIIESCVWNETFNNEERSILQDGFLLTGLLSVIFSAWLFVTLLFTNLQFDRSYRNLANFISVACIRRAVPLMLHLSVLRSIETLYAFQTYSCELFGFLETFLAVFEVECLTHVCIERYVLAKYVTNGWQVKQSHYNLYFYLCLFFSCLYSVPPLLGVGRYGYDFQCISCTFDVILPNTWQRYIVIAIFILRSIKPTVVMYVARYISMYLLFSTQPFISAVVFVQALMLVWANALESKFPSTMKHHRHFTRNVVVITVVNLLCWAPVALIRTRVIVAQLMFDELLPMSAFYVTWAMWMHWVAPAFTVIALFLVDDRVRYKLFNQHAPEIAAVETKDIKEN